MDRRDGSPESSLWETPAGRAWLIRLVVATLWVCGLKRGVGAETRSEFFGRLHVQAHVGCSPSALRTVMHLLARLVFETAAAWEQEGRVHGEIRPVIGAVDETFFQRMMLVFMDLPTGEVLMEEVAADRRFATWFTRTNERLKTFGTEVWYLVSDRAQALLTLAHMGFRCPSIPDFLHIGHDLAKGYSLGIFGRLRHATRELEHATQSLENVQTHVQAAPAHVAQTQVRVAACATAVHHWHEVGSAWRQRLAKVSRLLHPWRRADSIRQTSAEVEEPVRAALEAMETLRETNGLPRKTDTLDQGRKPRAGIAALVDLWWQTVRHEVTQLAMTPRWTQWAADVLLPLQDWQEQLRRTRHPGQQVQIALVLRAIAEVCERHPCTRQLQPEVLAGWNVWAAEHAKAFQRASSAVEGHNGSLSQRQHTHTHRGFPARRSPVWTALHTAARLTHRQADDLIEGQGREVLCQLLQGWLESRGTGDVGSALVGQDGVRRTQRRLHSRTLESVFGTVQVERLGYGAPGQESLHPLDAALNLPKELYSQALRKKVAVEAARSSFEAVVEAITEHTGLQMPKRQAEELCQRAAQDFDTFYAQHRAQPQEPQAAAGSIVVLTTDGKGVPMRKEALRPQTCQAAEASTHKLRTRLSKGEKRHRKRMATVASSQPCRCRDAS